MLLIDAIFFALRVLLSETECKSYLTLNYYRFRAFRHCDEIGQLRSF